MIKYFSHRLPARVQFAGIDRIKEAVHGDLIIIFLVIDQKQKILVMKFREGEVEYYGKTGMSLLGLMALCWKNEHQSSNSRVEYSFCDFAVGGHSAQETVQLFALLQTIVSFVKNQFPIINKFIPQSDNTFCFASQNLIPFIFHMNASNRGSGLPVIIRWIFTETQTGCGRLVTHFSYVSVKIK